MGYRSIKPIGLQKYDPVLSKFRYRLYNDDNDVFVIAAGKRGSTKSGDCLSLGLQTDIDKHGNPRFFLDEKFLPKEFKLLPGERMPRTLYMPSDLMKLFRDFEHYPIATAVLWDEVGVGGDARDFAKKKNKFLKRVFQTIRSLNWVIFLTAVTLKDFDVAFERNAGFFIKTFGKAAFKDGDVVRKFGKVKVYEIDTNAATAKKYYKNLQYVEDGVTKVLGDYYYIQKPPAYIEEPYKRYKKLFQSKLYTQYAEELDEQENFYLPENASNDMDIVSQTVEEVVNNPLKFFDKNKNKFILAAIQYEGEHKIKNELLARKALQLVNLRYSRGDIVV